MFDFPASPNSGQRFTPAGSAKSYVWDNVAWRIDSGGLTTGVLIADSPPIGATPGTLWFESDTGNTFIYYDDGDSKQWVQSNVSTPVTFTGAYELIAKGSASNVASIDINNLSAFRTLRGSGQVTNNATSGNHFIIQHSTNNGAAFDGNSANYGIQQGSTAGTTINGSGGNYIGLAFSGQNGIAASWESGFQFELFEFNQNAQSFFLSRLVTAVPAPQLVTCYCAGYHATGTARNALRMTFAAGNIANIFYVLEGVRG